MLSVIAAQNRNSPAQVVQKCARRLIDGTQCLLCDPLENVMSLQRSILGFLARGGHLSHRAGALNCQLLLLLVLLLSVLLRIGLLQKSIAVSKFFSAMYRCLVVIINITIQDARTKTHITK